MPLGPRLPLALALSAVATALLTLAQPAAAQASEPATEAPKSESLERAQKAADSVFRWIKLNAQAGANREKPAPAAAPAPVPVRKPAPAPVASTPKPPPVTAPAQPPAAALAAAPSPAPSAAVAAESAPLVASAAPTPTLDAPLAAAAAEPPASAPEEEDDDEPLKLLSQVEPVIPRQLLQSGFRRDLVQVRFTVGLDGKVQQAEVMKAHNRRLGNAAVEAVKQWRFAPISKAREVGVEFAFQNDE